VRCVHDMRLEAPLARVEGAAFNFVRHMQIAMAIQRPPRHPVVVPDTLLARLSREAYEDSAPSIEGFEHLRVSGATKWGDGVIRADLFRCSDEQIACCVFRGTDSIQAWGTNLLVTTAETGYGGEAHEGFVKAWNSVRDEVLEFIGDAEEFVFSGHSLGGALATLACWDRMAAPSPCVCRCVTFGAPRVLTHKAAGRYNGLLRRGGHVHIRYQVDMDLVPQVPLALRFRHVGQTELLWPQAWHQRARRALACATKPVDGFKRVRRNHDMGSYITALEEE